MDILNNNNNNNNIQPHIHNIHNILQWNDIRYTLDKHNNTFNDIHSMRRYILSQNTHRLRTNKLHKALFTIRQEKAAMDERIK